MMPKQLQLTDFYCRGCKMPHSLDAEMLCEFCRRKQTAFNLAVDAPLPLRVHIMFVLGLLVLLIGLVLALRI